MRNRRAAMLTMLLAIMGVAGAVTYVGEGTYNVGNETSILLCDSVRVDFPHVTLVGEILRATVGVANPNNPLEPLSQNSVQIPLCEAKEIVLKTQGKITGPSDVKYAEFDQTIDLNGYATVRIARLWFDDLNEVADMAWIVNKGLEVQVELGPRGRELCETHGGSKPESAGKVQGAAIATLLGMLVLAIAALLVKKAKNEKLSETLPKRRKKYK